MHGGYWFAGIIVEGLKGGSLPCCCSTFDFINTHYYGCDFAWIKGYLKKWYRK